MSTTNHEAHDAFSALRSGLPIAIGSVSFVMRHRYSPDNPDNYRDGAHAVVVTCIYKALGPEFSG